jgi:hypothetical protein
VKLKQVSIRFAFNELVSTHRVLFFPVHDVQTIQVDVYLPNKVFVGYTGSTPLSPNDARRNRILPCLLRLWFSDGLPFSLTDLTGPSFKPDMKPKCLNTDDGNRGFRTWEKVHIPVSPFSIPESEKKKFLTKISKSFRPFMKFYASDHKEKRDALSLVGSEDSRYLGWVSPTPSTNDMAFQGNLSRFFGEHLRGLIEEPNARLLVASCHGLNSIHRDSFCSISDHILAGLLGLEKAIAAKAMLSKDVEKANWHNRENFSGTQSVVSTMRCLENLGHGSEPFVEGFVEGFELLP